MSKFSNPQKHKRPMSPAYWFWYWATIGRVLFVDIPRAMRKERRK